MAAVDIQKISMKFGGFVAVDNVSANVADGEFVTLLGPSGCGKTTLLNLISGFLKPTSGSISIDGKDVTNLPPEKRDTAMCFQSYALFPHLTVEQNLAFGLQQQKVEATQIKARLAEVSSQLELKANLSKLPNQLSGGQQQRVALGRALAVRPSVILFDEPLSNLDAKLRETVRFEIRKIQKDFGLTAIYVTHDQAEALAMSDRVFVMNKGRVEQVGTPEQIYHEPATSFVADFIGGANILPAEVQGEEDANQWQLKTPIGQLLVKSDVPPASNKVRICWRPERGVIGPTAVNSLNANVEHRAFQGGFSDLLISINSTTQRLQTSSDDTAVGQTLTFSIAPEDIHFLEALA